MDKKEQNPPNGSTEFAELVEQGVRAYMHAQGLRYVTQGVQFIAEEALMGSSTLDSWRSPKAARLPRDYQTLRQFAAVCLKSAPELGQPWLTALFRAGGMAGYRDQALAEILGIAPDSTITAALSAPQSATYLGLPPALPGYHVARHGELAQLKDLVLAGRTQKAGIAVVGMAGVGKSTLMAALAHEAEIQAAFPGGIAWFEIKQGMQPAALARQIAQVWQADWPDSVTTPQAAQAALRAALPGSPVLLLLDNVTEAATVQALLNLQAPVVSVLTTRTLVVPTALRIPEAARVKVSELTPAEAWTLLEQFAPVPEAEREAAQASLTLLAYHPYAIQLTAGATQALQMSWAATYQALRHAARTEVFTALAPERQGIWASLNMDWEQLSAAQRQALAALGRLPFFSVYDTALGQAAWQMSTDKAGVVWRTLAAWQLVCRLPDAPEHYSLHWLVRDFAQQQAQQWTWAQRLRFALWPWRYRLPWRLHWWRPALPRPTRRWPWWSSEVPGTEAQPGWNSIYGWLMQSLWPRDAEGLKLRATPAEWVTVVRLSVRFAGLSVLELCWSGYGLARLFSEPPELAGYFLGVALVLFWVLWVTYVDLRRAVLLWGAETLPDTAKTTGPV